MPADARVRFVVELDSSGQVKAIQALKGMGDQAQSQGSRFGKGLSGSFQDMMNQWGKFVVAGAVVQRVWTSIADTMKKAADYAKARQSDWDGRNSEFRSDAFRRMTAESSMRMLGVTNSGTINTVNSQLDLMRQTGRGDAAGEFNGIAAALVRKGLSGSTLEQSMLQAVSGLGRRGHIAGFGEAYGALAGSKSVASGTDLTDMATGMVMRGMRLSEDQSKAMRSGIADGSISVDQRGMLSSAKDAAAEVLAAVKAVNTAGGLSLKAWEKPAGMRDDIGHLGYGYETRAGLDKGLDWKDPGTIQGDRPTGEAKGGDYVKAAFDSQIVQAAIAAAFMKAIDLALVASAAKVTARAAAAAAAGVAAGAGGTSVASRAATLGATVVTRAGLATAAAGATTAAFVLTASGDSIKRNMVPGDLDRDARLAMKSPELRQSLIEGSLQDQSRGRRTLFGGDDKGYSEQVLDRMGEMLKSAAEAMREAAAAQRAAASNRSPAVTTTEH